MTVWTWIGVGLAVWTAVGVALAFVVGTALRRLDRQPSPDLSRAEARTGRSGPEAAE